MFCNEYLLGIEFWVNEFGAITRLLCDLKAWLTLEMSKILKWYWNYGQKSDAKCRKYYRSRWYLGEFLLHISTAQKFSNLSFHPVFKLFFVLQCAFSLEQLLRFFFNYLWMLSSHELIFQTKIFHHFLITID